MYCEPSPETLLLRTQRGAALGLHGDVVTNSGGWHLSGLTGGGRGLVGWKPDVHRGDLNIQATAPHEATGSALSALRAAAGVSSPAFASAMAAEFGQSFVASVSAVLPDLRADLLAMP